MLSTAGVVLSASDTDTLLPGAKAGPWVIESELGRGGMGAVYAVTHEEIGKRAALKIMHRALVSAAAGERILTEARVVNRVAHANIVDIFETGTLEDGRLYIVMERLDGRPLGAVAMEGKLRADQVIAILLQICDALIAAHAAGVVHRDLKLDNVFLIENPDEPSNPRVKVLDWGIAKEVANDVRQTVDGQLVGTPQYLSPEQARGLDVGPPSDVYSLGVMAYELFLEQLPFEAETAAEVMTMHLRALPPEPHELWPEIPKLLENLLLQMLAKRADDRPSMLSVAHALESVRDELARRKTGDVVVAPVIAPTPRAPSEILEPPPARRLRRTWRIAAGALALMAAGAASLARHPMASAVAASPTAPAPAPVAAITAPPDAIAPEPAAIAPPATDIHATPQLAPQIAPRRVPPAKKLRVPGVPHVVPRAPGKLDPNGTVDPYS
jgi:serine/threonine protein kinase